MAITLVDSGFELPAFSSDIDFVLPSTFQADDLWVMFGSYSKNVSIGSTTGGVTIRYDETGGNGKLMMGYRVMTGSETDPVEIILTATEQCSGVWAVFRGVDTSTPFDVADGSLTGNFSSTPSWSAITPTTDGACVLAHLGNGNHNDETITWDGDLTEIDQTTGGSSFSLTGAAYEIIDPAASSGTYSGTSLGASTGWDTILSALRPAGGGGGGLSIPVAMHYRKMAGVS